MGVSLYYELKRETPLTQNENKQVEQIVKRYSETFRYKDDGEDFYVYDYDDKEPDLVFSGATKLPLTEQIDDTLDACLHRSSCLTEIRNAISGGSWSVSLDDTELQWDNEVGWVLSDEF